MFRLHFMPKMLYVETIDTELIINVQKVFLYDPVLIHSTSVTNRWTDGRETDDNGNINAYT